MIERLWYEVRLDVTRARAFGHPPGDHGGTGRHAPAGAALTLQARLARRTGRLAVQLQAGRASARAAVLPGPLPAGAWRLADLGAWRLEAFAALAQPQVVWLSRLQRQTAGDDAPGAR